MRNLIGLEMICFGKSKHFTLEYVGSGYINEKGQPVKGLMDMICFDCSASYFTLSGDMCGFCPNCGSIERKRFSEKHQLVDFLQGQDWSWLKLNGLKVAYVQTWEEDWQLRFTKSVEQLEQAGQYRAVSAP